MKTIFIYISSFILASAVIYQNAGNKASNFEYKYAKTCKPYDPAESKLTYWLLDSSITYKYVNSEWVPEIRTSYTTEDTTGIILGSINHSYNSDTGTWLKKDTCTISFFNEGLINEYIVKPWNNDTENWEDTVLYEKYDEAGNKTIFLSKTRDYNNHNFISGFKTMISYDQNIPTNYSDHILNASNNSWDSFALCNNTIIDGKVAESEIQNFNTDDLIWEKISQKVYTYDGNGYKSDVLYKYWKSDTEEWVNKLNYYYYYNGSGFLQYEEWPGKHRFEYSYISDNISNITIKKWDNSESDWLNSKKYIYSYSDDGRKIEKLIQIWDKTELEWIDFEKEIFYWTEHITVSLSDINKNAEIKIYPNPTSGILILKSKNPDIEKVTIKDITGKIIIEKTEINPIQEYDLSIYPAGMYLIHIQTGEKSYIEKIIKE